MLPFVYMSKRPKAAIPNDNRNILITYTKTNILRLKRVPVRGIIIIRAPSGAIYVYICYFFSFFSFLLRKISHGTKNPLFMGKTGIFCARMRMRKNCAKLRKTAQNAQKVRAPSCAQKTAPVFAPQRRVRPRPPEHTAPVRCLRPAHRLTGAVGYRSRARPPLPAGIPWPGPADPAANRIDKSIQFNTIPATQDRRPGALEHTLPSALKHTQIPHSSIMYCPGEIHPQFAHFFPFFFPIFKGTKKRPEAPEPERKA